MRGSFQFMKSVNKKAVLNEIRLNGPISRANIAKETGLTPPTVTNIVKELIEEAFVKESHLGESSGGRKPTLLQLNEEGYYVIGVDAGSNTIEAAVCNLYGHTLLRFENEIPKAMDSEKFLNIMKQTIKRLIEHKAAQSKEIIRFGVAMHELMNIYVGFS